MKELDVPHMRVPWELYYLKRSKMSKRGKEDVLKWSTMTKTIMAGESLDMFMKEEANVSKMGAPGGVYCSQVVKDVQGSYDFTKSVSSED